MLNIMIFPGSFHAMKCTIFATVGYTFPALCSFNHCHRTLHRLSTYVANAILVTTLFYITKLKSLSLSLFLRLSHTHMIHTWLPPIPWQPTSPTFSPCFLPMLSRHWPLSLFLICKHQSSMQGSMYNHHQKEKHYQKTPTTSIHTPADGAR